MKPNAATKQFMLLIFNGLLEDHQVTEKLLREYGAEFTPEVQERLSQDLADIKREIFETRERILRVIDETFDLVERGEMAADAESAKRADEEAMARLSTVLPEAREQINGLYGRLTHLTDAVFDLVEKSIRGSH